VRDIKLYQVMKKILIEVLAAKLKNAVSAIEAELMGEQWKEA